MNDTISTSLETVARLGAEAFATTALATDVGPTLRRVSRARVARVAAGAVAAALLVAAVTVGALGFGHRVVTPAGPSATPSPSALGAPVMVVINTGDTGTDIAHTLEDAGVIADADEFIAVAIERDDQTRSIQPGYYELPTGMSAAAAFDALFTVRPTVGSVTIPEGFGEAQIVDRVSQVLDIPAADLEAALADPEAIGLPPEANGNAEGWLGPYTYRFDPDASATEVLAAMVDATVAHLSEAGVPRDQWLRTLTIASLVEREAKLDVDRPKIARVIQNRLDAGMLLELDSTIRYAVGGDDSVFSSADDRQVDSPYNTYLHAGLPPGPIASPGMASIEAAIHPADGTWLYFVTINLVTGETAYATTFPEHQANVEKLRAWILEKQGY